MEISLQQSEKENPSGLNVCEPLCLPGSQKLTKSGAIEAERAKSSLTFKEIIAPGLMVEVELRRILASPIQSDFQKVELLETYFGKVCNLSTRTI